MTLGCWTAMRRAGVCWVPAAFRAQGHQGVTQRLRPQDTLDLHTPGEQLHRPPGFRKLGAAPRKPLRRGEES